MEPLSGTEVKAQSKLPNYWCGASSSWVRTVELLCANFRFLDAPWEYLERTNSSILASSLTACDAPAMPETYVMRNGVKVQRDQRVDICVVTSDSTTTTLELVECKLVEYDPSLRPTGGRILARLKDASGQVGNITGIHDIEFSSLPPHTSVRHTAAVIGLPCFQPGTSPSLMQDSIQQIIQDLKSLSAVDVVAWCFPEDYLGHPSQRYGKKFYPGTFLAVQAV
jgi:hypothetical protein